jgi:nucleotide-binding universal stress UspA family protein
MASHGRGGAQARPYGKVADDVLHEAPVPVLMIHTGLA